jgi:lysophospholipase L1-like esterase
MKKILKAVVFFAAILLVLPACDEYNELTVSYTTGNADFTRFVSVGNSLTMGEQSSAVFESSQNYSFGKMIARLVSTVYEQPIISDPGTGGRLEIESIDFTTGSAVIVTNPNSGTPTNLNYPAPYNNLGVKGAFLPDVLNARDASTSYTAMFGAPNPLFDVVLRGLGTQLELALAQNPTFVTLWIGYNDILAFATRGGLFPITDVAQFGAMYKTILDNIEQTGAGVVVGNICDVKNIPFFKTVGPGLGLALQGIIAGNPSVLGLVYQTTGAPGIGIATPEDLLSYNALVLLSGSSATAFLGDVTGAYYSTNGIPVPPTVNTAFPFGLTPQNPWPNDLILDPAEIAIVDAIVPAYNAIIQGEAQTRGYAVADVYSLLNEIGSSAGIVQDNLHFTSQYITGLAYSLDGVHPTSQGYGLIANEFIRAINATYNANLPLIDVSAIPGSLVLTKSVSIDEYGIPKIPHGALDHILF